jgi:hypothetical protein
MSLIRISDALNLRKWDNSLCDHPAIVKEWFCLERDPDPSVYWADSENDEVEVAASHSLTDFAPSLKGVQLLRIEWSDLTAVGALAKASNAAPGGTGVVHIDFRHWELVGAEEYAEALVRRIRERYEAGEQRFRWIGPPVLSRCLDQFCRRSDREVIQEAKRRCRHKLSGGPGTLPKPRASDVQRYFGESPPKIPENVVRERAFGLHQRLGRHDAFLNWIEAESELLAKYEAEILMYASPPPASKSPPT